MPQRIVVLGAGFAGLWSAVGAARKLDEVGIGPDRCEVVVINRDAWHCIRVRNYESDLSEVRVPLDEVLGPIGVRWMQAEVRAIDLRTSRVVCDGGLTVAFDRLVFALGSALVRPSIPGLAEHAFDVDTYDAAERLAAHLREHPHGDVVVVGAGLTGIEVATELAGRRQGASRVILADRQDHVGSDMGEAAGAVIGPALAALGVESRPGVSVAAVDPAGLVLASGERIEAATVIWCAGMRASPLAGRLAVRLDAAGRIPVDATLKVAGIERVFAAGDSAAAIFSGGHASVMSCQQGRPMGRFAGHNVVCDLFGLPMLPLDISYYVTILDLGLQGAVYTEGWDRQVAASGAVAKATKEEINRRRIYPPRHGTREQILAAAAPVVQTPPPRATQ